MSNVAFRFFPSASVLVVLFAFGCSSSRPADPDGGQPDGGALADGGGCGLGLQTAFCDTFNKGPAGVPGRAGDLDPARWSAGRLSPQEVANPTKANPAPAGPIPPCRTSLGKTSVFPDEDTLICDPTTTRSAQLMTAVAMQNYGLNSYRIRQPFDFAGRTGKIVFDVDAKMVSGLAGWVSIEVTEDPIPVPSFSDYERGPLPKNGIEIQFNNDHCLLGNRSAISVGMVDVYASYAVTKATQVYPPDWGTPDCVATEQGKLNHFEIQLSKTQIDVYGSDASPDEGRTFPNFHKIATATFNLNFTRGWVHVTARNHATIKYGFGPDAVYHWDNIGFDGPVILNWREYEIPDSLTPSDPHVNVGYIISDGTGQWPQGIVTCCPAKNVPSLEFKGVDLTNVVRSRLAFSSYYLSCCGAPSDLTTVKLRYRFNGGAWQDRAITPAEAAVLTTANQIGNLAQVIDVPLAELRAGSNTLEFVTVNQPQNYPTILSNIDLILETR